MCNLFLCNLIICYFQYEKNKSYCEDLTEGKFSFPLIHAIQVDKKDTQILNILLLIVTQDSVVQCIPFITHLVII